MPTPRRSRHGSSWGPRTAVAGGGRRGHGPRPVAGRPGGAHMARRGRVRRSGQRGTHGRAARRRVLWDRPVPGGRVNVGIVLAGATWRGGLRPMARPAGKRPRGDPPDPRRPGAVARGAATDAIAGASPLGSRVDAARVPAGSSSATRPGSSTPTRPVRGSIGRWSRRALAVASSTAPLRGRGRDRDRPRGVRPGHARPSCRRRGRGLPLGAWRSSAGRRCSSRQARRPHQSRDHPCDDRPGDGRPRPGVPRPRPAVPRRAP